MLKSELTERLTVSASMLWTDWGMNSIFEVEYIYKLIERWQCMQEIHKQIGIARERSRERNRERGEKGKLKKNNDECNGK